MSLNRLPRFGATLNISIPNLEKLPATLVANIAPLHTSAQSQGNIESLMDIQDQKDPLAIQVTVGEKGVLGEVKSKANGTLTLEGGSLLRGADSFLTRLILHAQAFAKTLLTPEERKSQRIEAVKTFANTVKKAIEGGDINFIKGGSYKAEGSFGMNGGHYSQYAFFKIGDQLYSAEKDVKKMGGIDFALQQIDDIDQPLTSMRSRLFIDFSNGLPSSTTTQFHYKGPSVSDWLPPSRAAWEQITVNAPTLSIDLSDEHRFGGQPQRVAVNQLVVKMEEILKGLEEIGVFPAVDPNQFG